MGHEVRSHQDDLEAVVIDPPRHVSQQVHAVAASAGEPDLSQLLRFIESFVNSRVLNAVELAELRIADGVDHHAVDVARLE